MPTTSSPPAPFLHSTVGRGTRATSTSPAGPLRRSFRVLKKSGNLKPEPKSEPKTRKTRKTRTKAPSGRGQRVNTSTPAVPPTADAVKSQLLVLHDTTGDATHLRPPQHHLKRPARGDSGKRSSDVLVESEPDEDLSRVSILPPSTALGSRGLLGDAGADDTECSPTSVYPPAATQIARQFLGHVRAAETVEPVVISQSEDGTAPGWSAAYAVDSIGGQPHILHDATEHTTHRSMPRRHLTWSARCHQGDTRLYSPEAVIKNEAQEDLTHLIAHPPDTVSTSRLPSGDTRAHSSKPIFTPEYEEEILYLPKVDPSLKYGGIVSQDGNTEIPLFVLSRRKRTNIGNTGAPTASPPTVRTPSLSTVTQMTSMDCFTSMFPWAKHSLELNKPTNVPYTPTPVLMTKQDLDTTEGGSGSENGESGNVRVGSGGRLKRTWDEASDEGEQSTDGEEVEEPRPQRRRKLLWAE